MKTLFRDTLITLAIAVVIFIGLQMTIQKYRVDGTSMNPNFNNGQFLLVNKIVYKFREPQRGDVIVFHPPGNEQDDYIKRIIGLPYESVDISDGVVYIHKDGELLSLDEDYISDPAREDYVGEIIPIDQYFVLGDNRNNSSDSRRGDIGTIPREEIIGKAWLSIWPLQNWGLVTSYSLQEQINRQINNE